MKIIIDYTANDIYKACLLHCIRSQWKYVLFGFGVLYLVFLFRFSNPIISLIAVGIGAFVGLSVMWVYLRLYSIWFFKKTPQFHVPHTFTITEESVRGDSSIGNGDIKWDAYVRARHNKKLLLLYFGSNLYQMFPKRVMTDAEWTELLEIVGNKLPRTV